MLSIIKKKKPSHVLGFNKGFLIFPHFLRLQSSFSRQPNNFIERFSDLRKKNCTKKIQTPKYPCEEEPKTLVEKKKKTYRNPQTQKSHCRRSWRRIAVRLDRAQIIEERDHLDRSAEATDLRPLCPREYPSSAPSAQSRSRSNTAQRNRVLHRHRRRRGVFVFLVVILVHAILTVDLLVSHSKSLRKKKNFPKISDQTSIGNQTKRAEVRVFWSEWKSGGNGGEKKRNFRSRKVLSLFLFFFLGK